MSSPVQKGFIIIADLSGYTSFVHGTELEHSQAILEELTKLLLQHVQAPFKMVQLEGDAVFYYVPGLLVPEPERVIENIEACYMDFMDHRLKIERLTNCQCRACSSIHTLDLKFVLHYGEYMVQKVSGNPEGIFGSDVILAHRLLKNNVTETTGLRAYALVTKACLVQIGQLPSMIPHHETYDQFGEIACAIYNLKDYEQQMRETRRVIVEPGEADYIYEKILNASPELLWSYIIDPARRLQWQNIKEVNNKRNDKGRMGPESEFHCDHGSFSRISRMLDWRPFHYMTNVTHQKFYALPFKASPVKVTYQFITLEDGGTKVSQRMRSIARDWFTMHIIVPVMRRMLNKENDEEFGRLEELLGRVEKKAKAKAS